MEQVRLEELAEWGQQIMELLGWHEGDSKRVNWAPNPRLIRYYTTLGLLDRAARFEGRVAFYGTKHLLQILAVKYLQLQGLRLEDIQQRLLGLNESSLAELIGARLPLPAMRRGQTRPREFWTAIPERRPERTPPRLLSSFEPIPGVQVLIDPERLPERFDLEEFVQSIHRLVEQQNEGGHTP